MKTEFSFPLDNFGLDRWYLRRGVKHLFTQHLGPLLWLTDTK